MEVDPPVDQLHEVDNSTLDTLDSQVGNEVEYTPPSEEDYAQFLYELKSLGFITSDIFKSQEAVRNNILHLKKTTGMSVRDYMEALPEDTPVKVKSRAGRKAVEDFMNCFYKEQLIRLEGLRVTYSDNYRKLRGIVFPPILSTCAPMKEGECADMWAGGPVHCVEAAFINNPGLFFWDFFPPREVIVNDPQPFENIYNLLPYARINKAYYYQNYQALRNAKGAMSYISCVLFDREPIQQLKGEKFNEPSIAVIGVFTSNYIYVGQAKFIPKEVEVMCAHSLLAGMKPTPIGNFAVTNYAKYEYPEDVEQVCDNPDGLEKMLEDMHKYIEQILSMSG